MRSLLGDVVSPRTIGIIPPASEGLSKDGIQGLFDTTTDKPVSLPLLPGLYVGFRTEA